MCRYPAYIIFTGHNLNAGKIRQWYLWRWEINSIFAMKRIFCDWICNNQMSEAVETWMPFAACSYALLLLAGHATGKERANHHAGMAEISATVPAFN